MQNFSAPRHHEQTSTIEAGARYSPLRQSPLREMHIDRERRTRYHNSRLATEVALLKYNTPYEKRQHSPRSSTNLAYTKSTAANTAVSYVRDLGNSMRCTCERRGRSPLQDSAYRPSPSRHNVACSCSVHCQDLHRDHCHETDSITRKNSLLPPSQANMSNLF